MNSQVVERPVDRPQAPRRQPVVLVVIAIALVGPGCTSRRLQSSTAKQAQTVVDLEYQQILDNLAMFSLNHDAMPSMAMLKTGATQVGDTGQIGFVGTAGLGTRFGSSPTFSGTRTIVDQWGSSPMTDDNNLMLVRKAFRCALGDKDLLKEEEANDLAHDLSAQIGTTSDMSVDQDTRGRMSSEDLVAQTMERLKTLTDTKAWVETRAWVELQKTTGKKIVPPHLSSLIQCIDDRLLRICKLEVEISQKVSGQDTSELEKKLTAEKNKLKEDLNASPIREEFHRLEHLSTLLDTARERAGEHITDTLNSEILAKSYAFDFRRKINVEIREEAPPYVFDGEKTKDTLVLEWKETDKKFEAQLYDHDGNIFDKIDIDDTFHSSSYQIIYNIRKNLWNPPYPPSDQSREILSEFVRIRNLEPKLRVRFEPLKDYATGLAKETIYRVNDAQKTLNEINPGWFRCGPEKPKDVCYVGHAKFCDQECYVWVCRDGLNELEEFTRKILKLGTTLKDVQVVTAPSGIQFAPALTSPGR